MAPDTWLAEADVGIDRRSARAVPLGSWLNSNQARPKQLPPVEPPADVVGYMVLAFAAIALVGRGTVRVSREQIERMSVLGADDGEVAAVQGKETGDVEPFGQCDHGRIDEAQAEIAVFLQ